MNSFIQNQQWRYATKKFDPSRKISEQDMAILKEAMRLSSSSYGLQPYTIFIVENPELRQQILPAAWNQAQVVEASHLIVFAHVLNISDAHIDNYLNNMAQTRGLAIEDLKPYGDFMKSKINALTEAQRNTWTSKQTYLALGNLLNAAAELKIDVTPMEGFEPEKVDQILGLTEMGLGASLMATIGYRHADDASQNYNKVRKSTEELFKTL